NAVRNPVVSAAKKQPQKGSSIKVKAKFRSSEQVTAKATGKVKVGGKATYKLKKASKGNDPGQSAAVTLKPKKPKGAKKITKALKKGKKATAKLSLKLIDDAGNSKTKKLSVKLKR
ncbi:MAG: hypothetical protein JJE10_11175, partial [Thermoleophilia bacterium]|nr:hypothetical protein [Thermoleophilia bacterium]